MMEYQARYLQAHISGSSMRRVRYFFFCSWFPAIITGIEPRPLASIAVIMPVQPYAIFSVIRQPSRVPNPCNRMVETN